MNLFVRGATACASAPNAFKRQGSSLAVVWLQGSVPLSRAHAITCDRKVIASARPTAGWSQWPDCDCLETQSHRPESEGSTLTIVVKRRQGTILVVRRHSGHIRKVAGIHVFSQCCHALPGTTEFNLFGWSSGARLYTYIYNIYLLPDTIPLLHNQLASPGAWDFTEACQTLIEGIKICLLFWNPSGHSLYILSRKQKNWNEMF